METGGGRSDTRKEERYERQDREDDRRSKRTAAVIYGYTMETF